MATTELIPVMEQSLKEHVDTLPERQNNAHQFKVAYIVSRFPKITETFVLYEMLAVEQRGVQVELYPLLRERTTVMHPEAKPFVKRAHFQPFISWPILRSHLYFLRKKPRAYLNTLGTALRATLGSFRFFTGILGIFPKTVYFAHLMKDQGIDHVHAHFASHPAAAAFIIHRLTSIPYSFTAHGSDLHRDRHMLREKVAEAAFVIPISNYNKEMIIEECGQQVEDKVIVIHCGVDTQVFQPCPEKAQHRQSTSPFNILCIGTLHEVKGQTYLIEACRLLHERGVDFGCHFVGDGPDMATLTKQVTRLGLTERICFHGRRTREDIAEMLQKADVLVAPSVPTKNGRREGIPVVLMEAMASGVPVIASSISGIPELVKDGHSGLLTPPHDAQLLADAIERLYHDPALQQHLRTAGREKVVHEFDLYTSAAELVQIFGKEH